MSLLSLLSRFISAYNALLPSFHKKDYQLPDGQVQHQSAKLVEVEDEVKVENETEDEVKNETDSEPEHAL